VTLDRSGSRPGPGTTRSGKRPITISYLTLCMTTLELLNDSRDDLERMSRVWHQQVSDVFRGLTHKHLVQPEQDGSYMVVIHSSSVPLQSYSPDFPSQPYVVQIMSSSSENFVSFHEFFQFRKNRSHFEPGQCIWVITSKLKHWLPSKMPALNYSVTHRIRHSCSYCTANGWREDQEQQFFYNGIRALERCWTKCISVAGGYVEK